MPNLQEGPNDQEFVIDSASQCIKMSPNSTTHNILQFSKGVLGLSLHLHLFAVVDSS